MALPQPVYANATYMSPPMKAPNGAIYVVVSNNVYVRVCKCLDPDTGSFTEQDSGDHPGAVGTASIDYAHACQYEHFIFVAYNVADGSERDIYVSPYNTETDQWATPELIYSGGPGEPPTTFTPAYLVASPNYLYCLHQCDDEKDKGTPFRRCMVSYRDLDGGSWTNSAVLNTGNGHHGDPHSLAVNLSENAVAFYVAEVASQIHARAWNRSSWGTDLDPDQGADRAPCAQSVSYMDGATNRILCRLEVGTTTYVWRLTSTGVTLTSVGVTTVESGTYSADHGGLARWGTTLYAWYSNSGENPAYEDSADHGASWSGAQHSDPALAVSPHPWANVYSRKGQLKVAIIYIEGGDLKYDERSITNPSAPGFASAQMTVGTGKALVSA